MNQGQYVFSQVMSFVSHNDFNGCVSRYEGDYRVREFSCWKQFLCMSLGQLLHRESLSDTVLCIKSNTDKLYHLGIGNAVDKSTLSRANEHRDWRIFHDFAMLLIGQARQLYGVSSQLEVVVKGNVFAIDATVIDLCLSVYSWAKFRKTKAAIKLHTQLDLKNSIPCFVHFTTGKIHEINVLDLMDFEADGFYIMDRGYTDFGRLYCITLANAFFVIRAKSNLKFTRIYSSLCDKKLGVQCDQIIHLKNFYPAKDYPKKLRRIKFYDKEKDKTLVFLTNNFALKATEIAQLYKHRWQIELFFKWLKQHLKIKSFWGHSANAVKCQVWIAITVYVLIAIIKKKLNLPQSMYEILQILSTNIFDKMPVNCLFQQSRLQNFKELNSNQLNMFEL
jgi:hypothetical protein